MAEKNEKKACLITSRAAYPIAIEYGKKIVNIPPMAKNIKFPDESLLGKLPEKIRKVTIEGGK